MSELAVIGIDANFSAQENIDRVERAFYQGKAVTPVESSDELDVALTCITSAQNMALANAMSLSDLAMIVVLDAGAPEPKQSLQLKLQAVCCQCIVVASLAEALEEAHGLILERDLVVALLGVHSHTSDNQPKLTARATLSFDAGFESYQKTAGIAAVLLSSPEFAATQQATLYAQLLSYAAATDIASTSNMALAKANIDNRQVGLLEVSALADKKASGQERQGLLQAYSSDDTLQTAISCARSVTGEGAGFSQVAGLLKTVICLHQRYIPALSDWQDVPQDLLPEWLNSVFYFPTESRPWFPNSDGSAHTAAYSCLSQDSYCHVVLQESVISGSQAQTDVRANGFIACSDLFLFLVTGDTQQDLLAELNALHVQLQTEALAIVAKRAFESYKASDLTYCVALIAESADDLVTEIQLAQDGIVKAFETKKDWKTPKGSYFSPEHIDGDNNVAFLYPGIGATYVGLGRDVFHLYPQIYQAVAALADDIGATLKDLFLNPRSITRFSFKELKQQDNDLRDSLANIAECGVGFACVFTKVFEDVFGLHADYSAGYSMGEISMFAALGVWKEPGLMSARLAQSDTFNHRLSGELRTLRSHWGLEDIADGEFERIWETYNIRATLAEVDAAAADEDRVYCTIINTHDSLLIGGFPEACERVTAKLGVRAMALNMPNAIHCAPAYIEYDDMEQLYTMDVNERIKTQIYSSSCYLPVPQRSKAIANSIAKCLCDPVDFPRLVNTLYARGARVFIEMGPGRSLCSWVDKIMQVDDYKPHISVPVNAKGTNDELTYIRALAKLASHRVEVNLDPVFYGSIVVQARLSVQD